MGHGCGGGGNPASEPPILTITSATEPTISGTVSECVDDTAQTCHLRVPAVAQGGGIDDPVVRDRVVISPQPGGSDTNQMQSLVEGTYGFVLEAESQAVPGTTSIYRGTLQALQ